MVVDVFPWVREALLHFVLILPIFVGVGSTRTKDFTLGTMIFACLLLIRTLFLVYLARFPWNVSWWFSVWIATEIGAILVGYYKVGHSHTSKRYQEARSIQQKSLSVLFEMLGDYNELQM